MAVDKDEPKEGGGASRLVSIYALCCPRTGDIKYVGKANDPTKRLQSHLRDSVKRNTPVYTWIRSLQKGGEVPVMRVLSVVDRAMWGDEERRLIALYRPGGLKNVADGGDEPFCSVEVRRENGRRAAVARAASPLAAKVYALKRSMGQLLKAGCVTESAKSKLRAAAAKRPDLFGAWATL